MVIFTHILENSEPPSYPRSKGVQKEAGKNKIFFWRYRVSAFLILGIIICFGGFAIINPAKANFWSFLEGLLGGDNADASQFQPINSQLIPLLHAPLNPEAGLALGGGDITIIGQSALLAEVGPLGSIADIEDKPPPDQISIYVVREGDKLTQIAEMFGVSVNTIIWANSLSSDVIKVGQTLIILPVTGIRYEVKARDTIESIAKKWKGDINEIIDFNNLTPGQLLIVGTIIIIPDGEAPLPTPTYSSGSVYRGGGGPSYAGYYIRPIVGGRKSQGLHGYNGVDLANGCGMPILASASGDVIIARTAGWNSGYGNYIVITHPNGTQTLYAHASSIIVGVGWHVVKGQVIGYTGATGKATGCHVHFEIRGAKNPF